MLQRRETLKALQGLRVFATAAIFLGHSGFLPNGTFPVTFFFMLSGFVMYYSKRELLNYPTYWTWLSVYVKPKIIGFYPLHIITFLIAALIGGGIRQSDGRSA